MQPAERRFLACGLTIAAVEAVLGLLLLGTPLGPYFLALAGATAVFTVIASRLMRPPPDDPPDDGGGSPPPPPPWWPQFESDLREYLRDRDREHTGV